MGADGDRRTQLDSEFQLQSAEDVATRLGQMKGAFMKVGQLLSFVDGMPEHIRAALAQLQDSAPPMSEELAAGVIRGELGEDPTVLFRQWDPASLAAASIGQVHRATLHDGREVAVKVQYPGIAGIVRTDLAHLDLGRVAMPVIWPHMDMGAVTAELRARLSEEVDYRVEEENQRDFARWYEGHPFIRIPTVIDELSTGAVLTTTYGDGDRFARFDRRSQPE